MNIKKIFLIICLFNAFIFAQSLTSIQYKTLKHSLVITLNFNQPLQNNQIFKSPKNYLEIKQISPVKAFRKNFDSFFHTLYVFSYKQNLYIAPRGDTPLELNYQIKNKSLILTYTPLLKNHSTISSWQYLMIILILLILIAFLYYIKRYTKPQVYQSYQTKKFFIDQKHFILDIYIQNRHYIVLGAPKGYLLLDKVDSIQAPKQDNTETRTHQPKKSFSSPFKSLVRKIKNIKNNEVNAKKSL